MLRLGRWKSLRPNRSPRGDAIANPRLERLAAKARAILFFERAWRTAVPPLVVLGFFVCVSWTGLWLDAPRWARGLGVLVFSLGLAVALLPLGKFRLPSRKEALDRIDRVSGLASHPAAVIDDRLGNGTSDPATRALWNLHRHRAEQAVALLRTGGPSPRLVDLDRHALRAAVLVALIATGFVAGPEKYARVAAAFDWRFDASQRKEYRIDAWIDPPAYTGKPPVVLNFVSNQNPQQIEAPIGSIIVIHAPGGNLDMEVKGALAETAKDNNTDPQTSLTASGSAAAKPSGGKGEGKGATRLVLRGDATLSLGHSGAPLGAFDIHAILDQPPSIALTGAPRFNARGSMTLKYSVADDYGVTGAEANFAKPVLPGGTPSKHSLVDPPKIALLLPPPPDLGFEAETTADLSEHPWAGARVEMTLTARDEGGNEGSSDPVEINLPQKPFVKPLARVLAEQRRNLVLAPEDKARVANALDALMIAPEVFDTGAGVYLGLRVAFDRLTATHGDGDLVEVADFLWQMALRIENGDLSEAERDLRAAEQQLRDALQRNAPEDEIRKLGENLRAAMDKFLQELAAQQKNEDRQGNRAALEGRGRAISPRDLQRMLDQMQEMLRSGDSANARKMLEQLQNILENLRVARPRKADPRAREMSRALDELGQMSLDQQDLRDETYQNGQAERHRQREERRGSPTQPTLGDIFGQDGDANEGAFDKQKNSQGAGGKSGKSGKSPPAGQSNDADLAGRQKALRDRLENLQKRLDEAGAAANGLDGAQNAMRDAERALGQGPSGTDGAVDAQGRAVEALREGAQKLADNMRGEAEGSGAGEEAEEGQDGQGPRGRFGDAEGNDPLGRPAENLRGFDPSARFPGAERARRVLEELRRRLGEPARPREEMDYLERLLRRY